MCIFSSLQKKNKKRNIACAKLNPRCDFYPLWVRQNDRKFKNPEKRRSYESKIKKKR